MDGPRNLSVLVVEEEPAILEFIARILAGNGMRALLAHSAEEAMEIAQRGYVPIDLVLTDVVVKDSVRHSGVSEIGGAELVDRVRGIRPGTRVLYMSAFVDRGVIRIQPLSQQFHEQTEKSAGKNLLESITAAASAPLTFGGGYAPVQ